MIEKKDKDSRGEMNNTMESMRYDYVVGYTLNAPAIAKVELKDKKITITGQRFFENSENRLSVRFLIDGKEISTREFSDQSATKLTLDSPLELKRPGCWRAQVKVGEMGSPPGQDLFPVIPIPKITGAARKESSIEVLGEELVDTSICGGPALVFQLVENKKDAKPRTVKAKIESSEKVMLELPDEAGKGSWTLQVVLNKEVKDTKELQ